MCIRTLIFSALLFFVAAPAAAQDWSALTRLEPGTRVYLTTRSGNELNGRIVAVSDASVELRVRGRNSSVARNDVLTVHRSRRGSFLKRTLIGAAAGAGIGAGVGAAVVAATKSDGLAAAGGFLLGIPAGAVIGAATTGRKRGELIYSAK